MSQTSIATDDSCLDLASYSVQFVPYVSVHGRISKV